jgi:3-hydroxyisobutyrate dehydrogenase-like beta-hydroxyacid dehydrogenase
MGEPIVLRLLGAGFQVAVWNRTQDRLSKVISAGAQAAADLAQLASSADAIFTMVSDDAAVDNIYRGPNGLFSCPDIQGKIFSDMSTILPETVRHIAEVAFRHGASFVDAPVAGTVQPARDGRLLVFAGGNREDVDRLQPVFSTIARRVEYLGPVGSGAAMKLVHNALLTTYWSVLAEAIAMGTSYGLDFKRMLDVIAESPAAFAALAVKMPALLGQSAETAFNIANVQKDLRTITSFAKSINVATPIVRSVQHAFDAAAGSGLAHEDVAAIVRAFKR